MKTTGLVAYQNSDFCFFWDTLLIMNVNNLTPVNIEHIFIWVNTKVFVLPVLHV